MRHKILSGLIFFIVCPGLLILTVLGSLSWLGWPASSSPPVTVAFDQNSAESAGDLSPPMPGDAPIALAEVEVPAHGPSRDEEWGAPEGLALLALFQTDDRQVASAVVLAEGYGAYRYGIGEWVAGDYLINDIRPDHVVMEGNGSEFKLFLVPLAGGRQSQTEALGPARVDGSNLLERSRAERERMRLLNAYDLYPVVEGAAEGYLIGERFPRDMQERVGIEPGDIILSVNGFAIGEPTSDEQAWRSAQAAEKASIVFQRQDGSIFSYHYPED